MESHVPSKALLQVIFGADDPATDAHKLVSTVHAVEGLPERLADYVRVFYERYAKGAEDVHRCVLVMGPRVVGHVAIQHGIVGWLDALGMEPGLAGLVGSSLLTRALIARRLAERRGTVQPDVAFTAALALELGAVNLMLSDPSLLAPWHSRVHPAKGLDRLEGEREVFNTHHVAAGVALLRSWGLPEPFVAMVESHHYPDPRALAPDEQAMWEVLRYADAFGEAITSHDASDDLSGWVGAVGTAVGWPAQRTWTVAHEVLVSLPVAAQRLGLTAAELPPFGELRERRSGPGGIGDLDRYEVEERCRLLEEHLGAMTEEIRRMRRIADQLGDQDGVTGLQSMGCFVDTLDQELDKARKDLTPLTLVVLDIDRFTEINGRHGFAVGDAVLKSTAGVVVKCVREREMVARLGSDQFAVLLRQDDREARVGTERIRAALEAMTVDRGGVRVRITATVVGVPLADHIAAGSSGQRLLSLCQRALHARRGALNRTHWVTGRTMERRAS